MALQMTIHRIQISTICGRHTFRSVKCTFSHRIAPCFWPLGSCGYCHSIDGATIFSKTDANILYFHVYITSICAKFNVAVTNLHKVTSCKTKWRRFWPYPVH